MLLSLFILILLLCSISILSFLNKRQVLPDAGILRVTVSFFLALSLISILYVATVFTGLDFLIFLLTLCAVSVILLVVAKPSRADFYFRVKPLILPSLCVLVISMFFVKYAYKWGGFDSFAIWSLHGKFLCFPDQWQNYLTNEIAWSHPDYPLMLPSWLALIWKSTGKFSAVVPSVVAYIVLIAVPLSAYSIFRSKGFRLSAILVILLFAFDTRFIEIADWLAADTLLALFFLLSFILSTQLGTRKKELFVLLGFFVASCGWIKNEGILFILVFSFLFLLQHYKKPGALLLYLAGALLPLLVLAWFKLGYAPPNDLFGDRSVKGSAGKIFSLERHIQTAGYFLSELWTHYKVILLLLAAALIFRRNYFRSFSFLILLLMLAGYYFIYILTPNDLLWHLETSCERLLHQLYPSFLFCITWSLCQDATEKK
jgi:hypothetical protein